MADPPPPPTTSIAPPQRQGRSASQHTAFGLLAGLGCGLFFGELCRPLQYVAQAFVDLLQMTVLPYVAVALVNRIGRLSLRDSRRISLVGGGVLLATSVVGILVLIVLPESLPRMSSGTFYSTAMIEEPEPFSLLAQVIPSNPFHALANGIVPAVVLFCICLGLAITGLANKARPLELLDVFEQALLNVNRQVVRFVPIGVFAIAASVAGTERIEEFVRLQGYFVLHGLSTALLLLWVLPGIAACCTPFSYREILLSSYGAVLLALATGKVLVAVPMIIVSAQQLLASHGFDQNQSKSTTDAVVPLAYPFPHLGRILSLIFVPFAAWYVGRPLEVWELPQFLATGVLTVFGSPIIGIPYLLDLERLPADLMQLFLATGVICGRLSDAVGAMHLYVIALLTACRIQGQLRVRSRSLVRFGVVTGLVVGAAGVALNASTASILAHFDHEQDPLARRQSLLAFASATVHRTIPESHNPTADNPPALDRLRSGGVLRVGYHPGNRPFSYFNADDKLVGLDVDMAHSLASDLDCQLEFIPFEFDTLEEQLNRGDFDVAMSGIAITPTRLLRMSFSDSTLDATFAFLVQDFDRHRFEDLKTLAATPGIRIGVARSAYFTTKLRRMLPAADIRPVDSFAEFRDRTDLDAFLISAEAGSAWTLEYPDLSVVVPRPVTISQPLGFAVTRDAEDLAAFLSRWIALKRADGEWQRLYDHWILGEDPEAAPPRWCVVRDVLGWVD